jgi:DegV family protein with EDD domain
LKYINNVGGVFMVRLVTDTTASFTLEEYSKYGITAVPLYIRENDSAKKELFEISYDQFYQRQRNGGKFSTSQPAPHSFVEIFSPIIEAGDEIICITLSDGISGTINSATLAKNILDTDKISIIDSHTSGYGIGALAIKAAEMISQEKTREEIVQVLENQRSRTRIYFVVESLRYLYEGGRLNGAQALIGSLIQIKPIITFDSAGRMIPLEKIRTLKAAKSRALELVRERAPLGVEYAALHYGDNYEEAREYAAAMEKIVSMPVQLIKLSPVIACHTGPDVLGPAVVTRM